MDFFVLLLNCEVTADRVATLLGRLFDIEAGSVVELLSDTVSELYYELRALPQAKTPRSNEPGAIFFVELCVYPHGQLAAMYESNQAFAGAFAQESLLPALIYAGPYCYLLFEEAKVYEVDEWPEDEETMAITVTLENKKHLPTR